MVLAAESGYTWTPGGSERGGRENIMNAEMMDEIYAILYARATRAHIRYAKQYWGTLFDAVVIDKTWPLYFWEE